MEALLAGEIVINNVDRDGTMTGYDEDIIKKIVDVVNIPVIALGVLEVQLLQEVFLSIMAN